MYTWTNGVPVSKYVKSYQEIHHEHALFADICILHKLILSSSITDVLTAVDIELTM